MKYLSILEINSIFEKQQRIKQNKKCVDQFVVTVQCPRTQTYCDPQNEKHALLDDTYQHSTSWTRTRCLLKYNSGAVAARENSKANFTVLNSKISHKYIRSNI